MMQFSGGCFWRKAAFRTTLFSVLAGLLGIAAGRNFLGSVCVVKGTSMEPTLQPGSAVYSTAVSGELQRGDIVVLDDGDSGRAVKRIVGLPGETVHIWRGYVYINRRILLEPYIGKRNYTFPRQKLAVFVLGNDQYFVLGDNRPCSIDSRVYG